MSNAILEVHFCHFLNRAERHYQTTYTKKIFVHVKFIQEKSCKGNDFVTLTDFT